MNIKALSETIAAMNSVYHTVESWANRILNNNLFAQQQLPMDGTDEQLLKFIKTNGVLVKVSTTERYVHHLYAEGRYELIESGEYVWIYDRSIYKFTTRLDDTKEEIFRFYAMKWVNVADLLNKLDKPSLPPAVKNFDMYLNKDLQGLVRDIEFWKNNRDFFSKRKLPYKRAYLLYGEPGTGKSSFIRQVSNWLDMDIVEMNPSDEKMMKKKAGNCDNRIVVFEDLDRGNLSRETLGTLMNFLQGTGSVENCLIFVTANEMGRFQEALIRPGRIDKQVYFGPLDTEGMRWLGNHYFDGDEKIIDGLIKQYEAKGKATGAEFTQLCIEKSMEVINDKFKDLENK